MDPAMPTPSSSLSLSATGSVAGTISTATDGLGRAALRRLDDLIAIYAQGRRAHVGGRSRRNHSTVAYAFLQSEVSSATLAP
jgi:hypothetical protein